MTGDHLAETIDRLIAFEPRVDAVVPGAFGQLYRVARRAQGAPLANVVPSDAAFIQFRYMAVPKTAAHPSAAQLFVNYVLSREAQDILYQRAFTDHYLLPGSKSAPAIQKLQASGVTFHDLDVQFIQRNDPQKLDAFLKQAVDILQKKG